MDGRAIETRTLRFVLARARTVICSEQSFIGHELGADLDGKWRPVGSREAVRFSLWGALLRAGASKEILGEARALFDDMMPGLNSSTGRAEALSYRESVDLLDAALERLSADDDAPVSVSNDRSVGAE